MGMDKSTENTLIIVKPDGVKRRLVGEIIKRFESKGLELIAVKSMTPGVPLIDEHYSHLPENVLAKVKSYMQDLCVVMIWRGIGAVSAGRQIIGATKPLEAAPGTIRGDFGMCIGRNIVHGSDSVDAAKREIKLWYNEAFVEPEVI